MSNVADPRLTILEQNFVHAVLAGREFECERSEKIRLRNWSAVTSWTERRIRADVFADLLFGVHGTVSLPRTGLVLVGADLDGSLDLSLLDIEFPITLVACRIAGPVDLSMTKIRSLAFVNCWLGSVSIVDSSVSGSLRIAGSSVDSVELNGTELRGMIAFENSEFRDLAKSVSCEQTSARGLHLSGITAAGPVDLVALTLAASLVVDDSSLCGAPRAFLAEDCRVGASMFFRLKSTPTGEVDVAHTQVSGPLVDNLASWPARIRVTGFTYRSIESKDIAVRDRISWLACNEPFAASAYSQLAKAYRDMGEDESARRTLIAREAVRRRRGGLGVMNRIWKWFLGATVGYGYKPWRAIVPFTLISIMLSVVFTLPASERMMRPTKSGGPLNASAQCRAYPCFSGPAYVVDAMLPIIDLHQEANWEPSPSTEWGLTLRGLMWFMIVSGWLLTSALVGGISLAWRRE